jgi:spore germination cell wall hydrolase CwlJ-like protein
MFNDLTAARGALKLGFFISSLTVASLAAKLATADISPDGDARALGLATARAAHGDLSDQTLRQTFNAEGSSLFARHDPGLKPTAVADLLQGYEQGPPLSRWDLAPQDASVVNQAVPISSEPHPPAKPFLFRGAATDREAAVTCLTQAVYYEAGFEPLSGAEAVAQVVLNRVRHPIFPKSICGVVYQGADLKTGCQFSFTCDGSLNKPPAAGAWARAEAVAQRALDGYVQKDVGEATHYHTQWIMPWWAPSVSKIAQVGTQIFYRWPGALGMPSAFNGRYAGNERVGKASVTAPDGAAAADGRVHAIIAVASATPVMQAASVAPTAAPAMETASIQLDAPNVKLQQTRPAQPVYMAPSFIGCFGALCRH